MSRVPRDRFLRYHSAWAQEIANRTSSPTDPYQADDGTPCMTLEGWPQIGTFVQTFRPSARPRTEALSTAPPPTTSTTSSTSTGASRG